MTSSNGWSASTSNEDGSDTSSLDPTQMKAMAAAVNAQGKDGHAAVNQKLEQ